MDESGLILSFSDPTSYLGSHWRLHGIIPGKKWDQKLDFGTNWWNGVTIESEKTPMCERCQNDTKEYSRLRAEITLSEFTKEKLKCSHHCLWFQWFHYQREKISAGNTASSSKNEVSRKIVSKTKK